MTNSEAVEYAIKFLEQDYAPTEVLKKLKDIVSALEENDKLKVENERLSRELKSEREWCPNTRIEEFDKKTEIEQLRAFYGIR